MFQELDSLSQDLDGLKHENENLRQNIRETQTLQAIVDTKVKNAFFFTNETAAYSLY